MRVSREVFAAIVAIIFFNSSAYGQAEQSDLEQATELLKAGKVEQSLALVDPIIERAMQGDAKDPTAICPHVAAAVLRAFMEGNYSISVENDWCDAMLLKAYALNELKRSAEAELVLEALVRHDPGNPQYIAEYAYTVRLSGQIERSLDLYKRAEKAGAKQVDRQISAHWRAVALRGQGYAYVELEKWEDAQKAYKKSLKYEPDNNIARAELEYIEQNRPR